MGNVLVCTPEVANNSRQIHENVLESKYHLSLYTKVEKKRLRTSGSYCRNGDSICYNLKYLVKFNRLLNDSCLRIFIAMIM